MLANSGWIDIFYVTAISVLGSGVVILVGDRWFGRRATSARLLMREAEDSVVFLFDRVDLIDATPAARALIRRRTSEHQTDWETFLSVFSPHFPHLRERLDSLAEAGKVRITSPDPGSASLEAEFWDHLVRIRFVEETERRSGLVDGIALIALEHELATLRSIAEEAPQLIWKIDEDGAVTWANMAYLTLAEKVSPTPPDSTPGWPPVNLFPELVLAEAPQSPMQQRVSLKVGGAAEPLWFEVTSLKRETETVQYALDISAVVRAEATQRTFVQTIGKTFAQLSIGLAIFDRQRRLMIFNPALTEMTGLPIEFLSSRPLIHMMLDRMREARMLPEPKNYSSWREQVTELEAAAQNGSYRETWDLPNGQTFRVTGRPHPDGAVAFLFEDISAEVSLTRRFRSEIEVGRAVLDTLDDAVAVFSAQGTLMLTNAAYDRLWQRDQGESLEDSGIQKETEMWQSRCAPSPIWGVVRDYLRCTGHRDCWSEAVLMEDGRHLSCRFAPLPGGATLSVFRIVTDSTPGLVVTPVERNLRSVGN